VAWFRTEEGDRIVGLDCRSHDLTGEAAYPARQIDRQNANGGSVHRLDRLRCNTFDRPIKTSPEERIDDEVSIIRDIRGKRPRWSLPCGRSKRGIAGETLARRECSDPHGIPGLCEESRRDEPVAAVVARSGHHRHARTHREVATHRLCDRKAGVLHEDQATSSGGDRHGVGLRHFVGRQNLTGVGQYGHRPTIRPLGPSVLPPEQIRKTRSPLLLN
jgi:hypothetical protein